MGKKSSESKNCKLSASKRSELKVLADAILVKSKESTTDEFQKFLEINALLDRIKTIEAEIRPIPYKSSRDSNSIDKFINWCNQEGAKFPNIQLKKLSGHDLGIKAKAPIKKDEVFVKIPDSMIFSYTKIINDLHPELKRKVFTDCPLFEGMTNVRLAVALMVEKINMKSKFKPYLDILPEKFRTVLYFTPSDMKKLQGTNAFISALKQVKFIAMMYAFLYKYLLTAIKDCQYVHDLRESFTYEFFIWAVSCVMTRQNMIHQNGEQDSVLIPLWDMANHSNGVVNTHFNEETNSIESFALKDFKKDDEVTMAYGDRSNEDFLVHNGFVFPENSNQDFSLRLSLSKSDELYEQRSKLLEKLKIASNGSFKILPELSPEIVAFARIFNMNKDQLQEWMEKDNEKVEDLKKLTVKFDKNLEQKSILFLLTRTKILLKAFPSSIDEDLKALEISQNNKTEQMLVTYRILEKKSLNDASVMLEKMMKEIK